jgi:hypothetical protein
VVSLLLRIELVGPDTLTGAEIAAIWASVLGHDVRYGGDDLATFESQAAGMMPGWLAHDLRLMLRAFHRFGMIPGKDSRATFEALIDHPLRSYRAGRRPLLLIGLGALPKRALLASHHVCEAPMRKFELKQQCGASLSIKNR